MVARQALKIIHACEVVVKEGSYVAVKDNPL